MKNRRRKKKKSLLKRIFIFLLIVAVAAVALIGARYFINRQKVVKPDEIEIQLRYDRPPPDGGRPAGHPLFCGRLHQGRHHGKNHL